jgi:hypothetical protein
MYCRCRCLGGDVGAISVVLMKSRVLVIQRKRRQRDQVSVLLQTMVLKDKRECGVSVSA